MRIKVGSENIIMSPCPEWMKEELAEFVVKNFSEEERKTFCDRINQFAEVD